MRSSAWLLMSLLVLQHLLCAAAVEDSSDAESCLATDAASADGACISASSAPWLSALTQRFEDSLWNHEGNACNVTALRASPPLTVAFGLSMLWKQVLAHRRQRQRTSELFEIHIIGATYPFEGRGDWSLLADLLVPHVPGVRIVLNLGTPHHADNVPEVAEGGTVHVGWLTDGKNQPCPNAEDFARGGPMYFSQGGDLGHHDASVICRKFGEHLQVDCREGLYQDVRGTLPAPDLVVMFSPGLGQLGRRFWDAVLVRLIEENTPLLIGDMREVADEEGVSVWKDDQQDFVAAAESWHPVKNSSDADDWDVMKTMGAYGLQSLGIRRNPFPLMSHQGDVQVAKIGVLQAFHGDRTDALRPLKIPDAEAWAASKDREKIISYLRASSMADDPEILDETLDSFGVAVSPAYDRAILAIYQENMLRGISRMPKSGREGMDARRLEAFQRLRRGNYVAENKSFVDLLDDIEQADVWDHSFLP